MSKLHLPLTPLRNWFAERLPVNAVVDYFAKKTVPRHKHSLWYYFGGLTLFFFIVQVATGILLSLYYKPTPEHAYQSMQDIMNHVSFGWLVRSVHAWGANLMIASLFVHMFSVFLMKAYRKPREVMWVSGVLLMFLVLGFAFTGYLLPWDTVAYFATLIGTEVPRTVPVLGDWGVSLLKGGAEIGAETLGRMYSIHIIILPLATMFTIAWHLLFNQLLGTSAPIGSKLKEPPFPFFPNFLLRDVIGWVAGLMALLLLSVLIPAGLGERADPLASAPHGIKPEWYFLPLYQTLRMVPARLMGVTGELVVNLLVGLATVLWVAIPFLDRRASKELHSRFFTGIGVLLILYLAITIILAYTT
jgi:cytochrome b6